MKASDVDVHVDLNALRTEFGLPMAEVHVQGDKANSVVSVYRGILDGNVLHWSQCVMEEGRAYQKVNRLFVGKRDRIVRLWWN